MKLRFRFQITPYTDSGLVDEVAELLRARNETESRRKYPSLWAKTDQLNASRASHVPDTAAPVPKKSGLRILRGIIFLLLGLFLLIPGIITKQVLLIVVGAVGIILGIRRLLPQRAPDPLKPFRTPALRLISAVSALGREEKSHHTDFFDDVLSPDGNDLVYEEIDGIYESERLYLFVWSGHALLLQKKDLCEGEADALSSFLEKRTGKTITFCTPTVPASR